MHSSVMRALSPLVKHLCLVPGRIVLLVTGEIFTSVIAAMEMFLFLSLIYIFGHSLILNLPDILPPCP